MSMRPSLAALVVTTVLAPAARAQDLYEPAPASPARALLVPGGAVAGEADATSVETNPGQLGLVDASSGALVFDQWPGGSPREGRGLGLMRALPLLPGRLSLGAGFSWLRPSQVAEPDSYYKLALAAATRMGRGLGLGASWEHLFGSRYGGYD